MTDDLTDVAEAVTDAANGNATIVITTGDRVSYIGGHISDDIDEHPIEPSLWMLAMHIHHIRETAHDAGGDATVDDVVQGALERLRDSVEVQNDD